MSLNVLVLAPNSWLRCASVSRLCATIPNQVRFYIAGSGAVVSRFPYLIFYVARPERVAVLAVLHHARNPAVWPRR
jgi:plasmid stabilization system protein ParE